MDTADTEIYLAVLKRCGWKIPSNKWTENKLKASMICQSQDNKAFVLTACPFQYHYLNSPMGKNKKIKIEKVTVIYTLKLSDENSSS